MGKARKVAKTFGFASGRHTHTRKAQKGVGGRHKSLYKVVPTAPSQDNSGNDKSIVIKLVRTRSFKSKKRVKILQQREIKEVYKVYKSTSGTGTDGVKKDADCKVNDITADGYRFINLASLQSHISEITLHAAICFKCKDIALSGNSPIQLTTELGTFGLASVLLATCKGCGKEFQFETSPRLNKNRKSMHFDINVRSVWGSLVTGNGMSHLNEFMACTDSPDIGQKTFSKIENEINHWWNDVLQKDLNKAIEEEKQLAISRNSFHQGVPSITVICDGGWSKRSHKHSYNALGGVAIIIGAETKKLLHVGIRNKYCYICTRAHNINCEPKAHECFKNWDKSSQAMESDAIVEGFLRANDFGVRYMNIIGDGDSSVFAKIREEVPVWGSYVSKLECSNHVCKCLRSHLEDLVSSNEQYKGRGNLSKSARIRLVSSVRCAIRMRSGIQDKKKAAKQLAHDIRNCAQHLFGNHKNCSSDFCKSKNSDSLNLTEHENEEDDDDSDILLQQSRLWEEGTSLEAQEQSRFGPSEGFKINSALLKDLNILLDRVAAKSERLIGNFTTNLAEAWMHMRSKFDGGKIFNLCNRGSWHTRCYAGALRFNIGPTWSTEVWEESTGTKAGTYFQELYKRRARALKVCKSSKSKPQSLANRWKRKLQTSKEANSTKAKKEYGKDAVDVTPDLSPSQLSHAKEKFLTTNINISLDKISSIEKTTRLQSSSPVWNIERKKRLTSSHFGKIIRRNPSIKIQPIVSNILHSSFFGNKATRNGLRKEHITIQEYEIAKQQQGFSYRVKPVGLIIDPDNKFLAASPDGVVTENNNNIGLIEIKNLLYDKPVNLTMAAKLKSVKNFCLQYEDGKLHLNRDHDYFFQIQGQLNISKLPWVDFVIRTDKPYELHIERIERDIAFWENTMCPKLQAFYNKALLPELAAPRDGQSPGIREPGIWYHTPCKQSQRGRKGRKCTFSESNESSTCTSETSTRTSCKPNNKVTPSSTYSKPDIPASTCSYSNTSNNEIPPDKVERTSRRNIKTKFVGRRIAHQWIMDNSNKQWFTGNVLSLVKGTDGNMNAIYEVKYDSDDEVYEVDHIVEDYKSSQVRFIDI